MVQDKGPISFFCMQTSVFPTPFTEETILFLSYIPWLLCQRLVDSCVGFHSSFFLFLLANFKWPLWVWWFFLLHNQVCYWSSLLYFSVLSLNPSALGLWSTLFTVSISLSSFSFCECIVSWFVLVVYCCFLVSHWASLGGLYEFFVRHFIDPHFFGVAYWNV